MNKFILLSIISLSLLGCISKQEKADYEMSYHYPSEESTWVIDSVSYYHYDDFAKICSSEIKDDTLIIHLDRPSLSELFGRPPTLDYFLKKFPKHPSVTKTDKGTHIVKYKDSIIEVISEEIFREYNMVLIENAVIVDTCDIFTNRLLIGMSKQQCMDIFSLDIQYYTNNLIKIFYFEHLYQWLKLTFNAEEILEKIELDYTIARISEM